MGGGRIQKTKWVRTCLRATGGEDNNEEEGRGGERNQSVRRKKNEEGVRRKPVNVKVKEDNSAHLC